MANAAARARVESRKETFIDPAMEYQATRWTEDTANSHSPIDPGRALSADYNQLLRASNRREPRIFSVWFAAIAARRPPAGTGGNV